MRARHDQPNVAGRATAQRQRAVHGLGNAGAFAFTSRQRRFEARGVAVDTRQRLRAALTRVFGTLEHHDRRALRRADARNLVAERHRIV